MLRSLETHQQVKTAGLHIRRTDRLTGGIKFLSGPRLAFGVLVPPSEQLDPLRITGGPAPADRELSQGSFQSALIYHRKLQARRRADALRSKRPRMGQLDGTENKRC
ncbi:Hypothetical protein NTJ_04856 [Nesidiocoris tenuis]|uniref:Uncharacterized protein n=1 Tax=Nesidiocoris tenuis TaxID=355587 RepID=A0ABN7ANT1_9HEMI|nr:Hypothetical protein NTJ_04856 [Nesidiocoris tenuis]